MAPWVTVSRDSQEARACGVGEAFLGHDPRRQPRLGDRIQPARAVGDRLEVQQDDAHHPLARRRRVGQPHVGLPREPQHGEHGQTFAQARPGRILEDEPGDLGYREHKDEIEEKLQGCERVVRARLVDRSWAGDPLLSQSPRTKSLLSAARA